MASERRHLCGALLVGLALSAIASPSAAAPATPDARTRQQARDLASEGDDLIQQGNCVAALDRLSRAYALVSAPTISILEARCLAKLGRLLEAASKYEQTRQTPLDATSPKAFREAVAQVDRELAALKARIPRLRIVVSGVPADTPGLRVELDGAVVPSERLGTEELVNPGVHDVVASYGAQVQRATVTVAEREARIVELAVSPTQREAATSTPASPSGESNFTAGVAAAPDSGSQSTWGWLGVGIGAAGLIAGSIAGVVALDKKSTLDEVCQPTCPAQYAADIDTFRTTRTVSWIGFGVGVVGLGVGLGLLATADSGEPALDAWLGPESAGVRGVF